MINYSMDGRETIALRGYENQSLSSRDGSIIYNKFSIELRYPITLKPTASIYALTFLEAETDMIHLDHLIRLILKDLPELV